MPPCNIDARRCYELLTTLQEDVACMLSGLEGEPMELNLTLDIVTRALKIQEGNYNISNMKLTTRDWLLAFMVNNANDSVYSILCNDEVQLALQIHL